MGTEFIDRERCSELRGMLGIGGVGQGLRVNLVFARTVRHGIGLRIKIADTAFVNKFPIQKNEAIEAIDKYRNGFEEFFIEIVVNGPSTCKGDFAFFRVSAKNNSYPDFHRLVHSNR